MMESLVLFLSQHAEHIHYYLFSLLMLAGLNLPISEDLVVLLGGGLSATLIPENTYLIFMGIFLGAYLSDWVAYGIGRKLGPKIFNSKWFSALNKKNRPARIQKFYQKYGAPALLVGRFIPFGVRNALFLTAGMGKMPFGRFIFFDGIACLISNALLFYLGFSFGKNYEYVVQKLKTFNIIIFAVFVVVIALIWYKRKKSRNVAL